MTTKMTKIKQVQLILNALQATLMKSYKELGWRADGDMIKVNEDDVDVCINALVIFCASQINTLIETNEETIADCLEHFREVLIKGSH